MSQKVVVAMKGYLGDTVMATPLLEGLRAKGVDIKISAPTIVADVLGHRWAENVLLQEHRKGFSALKAQVRAFRRSGARSAILVNRSFRSALSAWLARVPSRVGHATEGRTALLTKSLPYDPLKSEIACYQELAGLAGIDLDLSHRPHLLLSDEERNQGREALKAFERPNMVFALQPGARYREKQLPLETSVHIITRLREAGYEPVLVGGPEEAASAGEVQDVLDRPCADLVGQLSLRASLGVLANVRFAVGADTGLMHLAVAVETPTVTVFGPNPASKWGHSSAPHQVIQAPGGVMANVDAETLIAAALMAAQGARSSAPVDIASIR